VSGSPRERTFGRAASPSEKTARVNIILQAQEEVKRHGRR